jgi:drug/metabolite transporter superfamily protein YnfA
MARAIAVALGHPFGVGNAHFRLGTSRPREVDTVPFGCYRRSLFDRIGRFDEELVRNQDDELNHRLLRAGGRIVLVPDVVAHYYARATLRELARTYYQYGYFKPLALAKVGRAMTLRPLLPPAFVLALGFSAALAPASATAARVFAVVAGLYLVAALVAATLVARRVPSRVAACLPVVFMALHLSYGVGYLAGAWRWLGRPRGPFARHAAPHSNGGRPA